MPAPPSHDELEVMLRQSPLGLGAAELQGSLAAQLCFEAALDPEQWLAECLGTELSLYELEGALREALHWLFDWSAEALRQRQFEFQLLLPGDEAPLELRTAALAQWCAGYTAAMGPRAGAELQLLPDEGRELVRDLVEISRAEFHGEATQADESQFLDLAEYARLGAMTLYESLSPSAPDPGPEAGFETGDDPSSGRV